jgi:hypothetical protein
MKRIGGVAVRSTPSTMPSTCVETATARPEASCATTEIL